MRRALADVALASACLLAGRLSLRHYRSLPRAGGEPARDAGHVTIVIPARNEGARIGPLLRSLSALRYGDVDVIVADDDSTDGTVAVARSLGARVIETAPLPSGWTGKCHACARAADATDGEWLLFTDADTVHAPDSLGVSLALAERHAATFVSLLCRQQCRGWWEDLLIPYAYFLYFCGYIGGARNPVLNGQYILCRRAAYERVGGHEAVRGSVIEDVALAQLASACGERILLARGERYVSVRMYDSFRGLREGFAKNAAQFVRANPAGGVATALAGAVFLASAWRTVRTASGKSIVLSSAAPAVVLAVWRHQFGMRRRGALLYPLSAAVFQFIALESLSHVLIPGRATWRGRRY